MSVKKKFSKKGAIEVQFNWIFVIIVGSLILLFFVSVVKSMQKSSEESLYVDIQEDIKNIISQAEVDVGTTRTIGIPKMEFEFECQEFGIKKARARGNKIPYSTIFSPDIIKGREIIVYSLYWNMPYPVEYMLFVTSKQMRYNFVNSTKCTADIRCQRTLNIILKMLPANMTYQIVNRVEDAIENNYYKERFILINETPGTVNNGIEEMNNEDVTAVNIVMPEASFGSVDFYKKDGANFELEAVSEYLGAPMLLGSVVSEASLYECNVNKTLLRYKIMTTIYANRTNYLLSEFLTSAGNRPAPGSFEESCYAIYETLNISKILNWIDESPSQGAFYNINREKAEIFTANYDTIKNSCPLIY